MKSEYFIKFTGEIIGANGRALKPNTNRDGYKYVIIYTKGVPKTSTVHRLVAEEFISNPNNYPQVNHIDENKLNNHVSNLEWCTDTYNKQHSSKLDWSDIHNIRSLCKEGVSQGKIAERFNVDQTTISLIKLNKTWIS